MNIEEARHRLGMTQAQLGKEIGVSVRTIQNWEWGVTTPHPSKVKAIEALLAEGEPMTTARLWSIIESQQRTIDGQQRTIEALARERNT